MSGSGSLAVGSISWVDLTVADAPGVRDFYAAVTGWKPAEVSMGKYSDYCMNEPASATGAGPTPIYRRSGSSSSWSLISTRASRSARREAARSAPARGMPSSGIPRARLRDCISCCSSLYLSQDK